MSKFITIDNATIVSSMSSTGVFILSRINNQNVGLPIFTFDAPLIDLLPPTPSLKLDESTVYAEASTYGMAITINIETSTYAIPIFQVPQNESDICNIVFDSPTIVADLSSTGTYLVISVEGKNYGLPLYFPGSILNQSDGVFYPSDDIESSTVLIVGKPTLDVTGKDGSTYLNPKIEAYSDIILRVKKLMGWPSINIDICDENIADFVDQSIELYTKYAGYTEEFLIFNSNLYKHGTGIRLDKLFSYTPEMSTNAYDKSHQDWDYDLKDYRKVVDVWSFEPGQATGVNTLFTLEQAMAQQTYFSYMLGNCGFDLITWEIMKGWLETRARVLAQNPYFRFDPKTQMLRILPEPYVGQYYYGVIGCYVESPVKHLVNEPWIWMYVLALVKIAVGTIRSKYQGMVIFGGGTVNGNDLLTQGTAEKAALEDQLLKGQGFVDSMPPKFFMG